MIELPRDAEGREIPLDTEALYNKSGEKLSIYAWEYMPKLKHSKWRVRFLFDDSGVKYYPDEYYLTPPDSWQKLEEDLGRSISGDSVCRYFAASENCEDCRIDKNNEQGGCTELVLKDIVKRIRKLRGEDE